MPIIFSAKLDGSEAVRYTHVSLVTFYLRQARAHAISARSISGEEEQFSESLLAVILAALCLEAFANETGENVLPNCDVNDFLVSRRRYRKPKGLGSVSWKVITVFEKKWAHVLSHDCPHLQDVESLFEMRNALVHYAFGESAAKSYLPPPTSTANEATGEFMTTFNLMQQPTRIEAPLVAHVNAGAAARAYNTALQVLKLWNQKANAPAGALSGHEELAEA